jgi:uncharacterized membrane protein YsdA (DUF1294 family)
MHNANTELSSRMPEQAGTHSLCNAITLNLSHSHMGGTMNIIQIPPLLVFLVIVNVASLIFFGVDKLRSMRGDWRIPESRLLLVAFFGPFGAYAGMLLFRHKIRKAKFLLVPIFLFIQLCLIVYFRLI